MLAGLSVAFDHATNNPAVRAVVVRGEGEKAFASGADIGEHHSRAATRTRNPDRGDFLTGLRGCTKPVVAMIHGYCIGGGLMVAMAADIRIAADDAVFCVPAGNLGVAYPLAAVQALVDLIGAAWATDLALSADRINATTAQDIGLVTRVHPKAELESATEALLTRLAGNAPLSAQASKASVGYALSVQRPPTDDVVAIIDKVWASDDAKEGMAAFLEKRSPKWLGS